MTDSGSGFLSLSRLLLAELLLMSASAYRTVNFYNRRQVQLIFAHFDHDTICAVTIRITSKLRMHRCDIDILKLARDSQTQLAMYTEFRYRIHMRPPWAIFLPTVLWIAARLKCSKTNTNWMKSLVPRSGPLCSWIFYRGSRRHHSHMISNHFVVKAPAWLLKTHCDDLGF